MWSATSNTSKSLQSFSCHFTAGYQLYVCYIWLVIFMMFAMIQITNIVPADFVGQFGDLFLGQAVSHAEGGQQQAVVVKQLRFRERINFDEEKLKKDIDQLLPLWSTLSHPNIGAFIGTTSVPGSANYPSIVVPFYPNGNIRTYIEKNDTADRLRLVQEASRGLEYLHSIPFIHGNIYPGNIFVNGEGHAVLADIGLNNLIRQCADNIPSPECYRYMPRELLIENAPPTLASDIYSFGRTIEELFTLSHPFPDVRSYPTFMRRLESGQLSGIAEHGDIPLSLRGILQECVTHIPDNRPTAGTISLHLESIEFEDRDVN